MKQLILISLMFVLAATAGCSSRAGSAGAGALGGAAVGAGAYEYKAHRELEKLEEDYKAGRIDKKEYEIRKDQIQKGSILK
ncbi:MAG: hypothetical protein K8I29_14190 [Alphaproteobacteria bacterium]|uniref:SHOCT domain-containing protein n=1 Tax=Candidatus Nitrobium versatile TaxID=2884831 RepID=A0A953J6U3_9BACT|nr:hypothetical protein [Candidatus Nitrobium versatile]